MEEVKLKLKLSRMGMERVRRVFSTQSYKHRTRRNHTHDDKLSFCRQPHRKLEWLGVREENRKGEC